MTTHFQSPLNALSEAVYKKRIRAWVMYDWANSAFSTTIMAAVLPVYYSAVAGSTLPSEAKATQYWAIGLSFSVFIIAILSPILGTISDIQRGKKKFLGMFVGMGVIGTGLLVLVGSGDWLMASIFFVIARIGNGGSNVFYDALLPHVAREEDQDKVSTRGYALGYLGGGLLLAINVAMIQTIPGEWGVRLSFLSVAIWWAIFSVPIFRSVPEPETAVQRLAPGESLIRVSFGRIKKTFAEIRQYRELFKYLVAYLLYNDGIGTIIGVAAIYGAELGFGTLELILALLLVQFVGIPFSLIFGSLPSQGDKRQPIFLAFILFNIVMLPVAGVSGRFLLPQTIVGTPSAPFDEIGTAVGEGVYTADATALSYGGVWEQQLISGAERGVEDADDNLVYAQTRTIGDEIRFTFNGQKIDLTHKTGPDHGTWAVYLDGRPLLDADGQPILIDAYNETVRYDVVTTLLADDEGIHELAITNTAVANPASSGTVMAIAKIEVLPPLRTSNLGMVLGLLIALQAVGALFAIITGPRWFSNMAQAVDTKRAILIAIAAYALIAVWGFGLNSVVEYWFLAWMVAIVQGGSQALSRSLYASMSPPSMSGEFFGLFSIMSKFASFISPTFFIIAIAIFNSSRPGILSIVILFAIGGYLLTRVDVAEGRRLAQAKEQELRRANS